MKVKKDSLFLQELFAKTVSCRSIRRRNQGNYYEIKEDGKECSF